MLHRQSSVWCLHNHHVPTLATVDANCSRWKNTAFTGLWRKREPQYCDTSITVAPQFQSAAPTECYHVVPLDVEHIHISSSNNCRNEAVLSTRKRNGAVYVTSAAAAFSLVGKATAVRLDKRHVAHCANTQSTGVGQLLHDRVISFSRACSDDLGVWLPDGAHCASTDKTHKSRYDTHHFRTSGLNAPMLEPQE